MKTYMVSKGEYSDYGIEGVFTTKENAEKYIKVFGGLLEEVELDPFVAQIKPGTKPYLVQMTKEGKVKQVDNPDTYRQFFLGPNIYKDWSNNKINMWFGCFAKNKAHAVKIAGEERTRLLANDLWKIKE